MVDTNNFHSDHLIIDGTQDEHRSKSLYDFIVVVNPAFAQKLNNKEYVVVLRQVDNQSSEEKKNIKKPLRVYAKLLKDPSLEKNEIRMDQTLRNALGIPYEEGRHPRYDLRIFPIVLGWRQKINSYITSFLGRRYLFLRVAKPYPPDLEKNICRLSNDALSLLGTSEGNRIVLVSCIKKDTEVYTLKNSSIKAFDLKEEMLKRRKEEEAKGLVHKWSARYVNAGKLLKVEPDISYIFLDLHTRNKLNLEPGDPVKVRRDFKDLFMHQLLEGGIVLAISAIALTRLLPTDLKDKNYALFLIIAGLCSALFTCLVLIFRLRSKIR